MEIYCEQDKNESWFGSNKMETDKNYEWSETEELKKKNKHGGNWEMIKETSWNWKRFTLDK